MIFSYNWLQSFFQNKLPKPKELASLLTMHSFEVEGVKKVGSDYVFDIDVTPNRPDCFSHLGIAKECFVLLKSQIPNSKSQTNPKFQIPKYKIKKSKKVNIKDFVEVRVEKSNDCSRYTGMVIQRVKVKASPKWIQKRLIACGVQPINNIVDATNYVMLETGQPLHAFDLDKLSSVQIQKTDLKNQKDKLEIKKIIIRRAKEGETIEALDDKEYELNKDILVIADTEKVLAIAGIKGGKSSAIDVKTKNIFIEAANFNPALIHRASRQLRLRTDASLRFEHGLDPNLTQKALRQVAALIQEIGGGIVLEKEIDIYSRKAFPRTIKLNLNDVEKLLGIKIPKSKITAILKSLNFQVKQIKSEVLKVEVPTIRRDINLSQDLIEEVGRIYGYNHLPSILPEVALALPEKNYKLFWQKEIKDSLKELGFFEVYNYSFIAGADKKIWPDKLVTLQNPISDEFKYLRPSLLINLLKNVRENSKNFSKIRIFELGKVFREEDNKPFEREMISFMATKSSFYEIKGIVDTLLNRLGISDIFYDDFQAQPDNSATSFWDANYAAEIKVNGKKIGFLGKLAKSVLDKLEISGDVFACDIEFNKLIEEASEENEYQPISKFPAAVRDLAILVPIKTKVVDILNIINEIGESLVRDIDMFDEYVGDRLPEGKKSLAFHIIYQAQDHTLSSDEISQVHQKIINALERNPEWEVRK